MQECSSYCTTAIISRASKVILKISHARLQQYVNRELADVQAGFRKSRGTRGQIASIHWIIEKAREFQKKLTMPKPLCGSHKLWIILQEMGIPDHLTCLLRNLYVGQEATVRPRHGTMDWFQIGKGGHQGGILSPACLTSTQSTSSKMLGWMKHELESRLPGEMSNNLTYADDTTLMAESENYRAS